MISPALKASYGLLGTTFGGNHLACAAALAVLEVIEQENLLEKDPAALGKMMKKMGKEMGEELPAEFDEVVDRLEAGQSPEDIESALPDLSGDENP